RLSERAVDLDPEGHDCWSRLALSCYLAGDFDAAEQHYLKAIAKVKTTSYHAETYRAERAVVFATLNRSIQALDQFQAAGTTFDDEKCDAAKAYAMAMEGRDAESHAIFQHSIEHGRHGFWTYFFLGRSLLHSGQATAATEAFRHVLESESPEMPAWLRNE